MAITDEALEQLQRQVRELQAAITTLEAQVAVLTQHVRDLLCTQG